MEKTIKQECMFDVTIGGVKSPDTDIEYIKIKQDTAIIFVDKRKLVEFLKTVNTFK